MRSRCRSSGTASGLPGTKSKTEAVSLLGFEPAVPNVFLKAGGPKSGAAFVPMLEQLGDTVASCFGQLGFPGTSVKG